MISGNGTEKLFTTKFEILALGLLYFTIRWSLEFKHSVRMNARGRMIPGGMGGGQIWFWGMATVNRLPWDHQRITPTAEKKRTRSFQLGWVEYLISLHNPSTYCKTFLQEVKSGLDTHSKRSPSPRFCLRGEGPTFPSHLQFWRGDLHILWGWLGINLPFLTTFHRFLSILGPRRTPQLHGLRVKEKRWPWTEGWRIQSWGCFDLSSHPKGQAYNELTRSSVLPLCFPSSRGL